MSPICPRCVAVSETREEMRELTEEAIEFHLVGLSERGLSVPDAVSSSELVEIGA